MSIVSDYSSPVAKEALRRQRIASSLTSILISILILVLIGLVMALILLPGFFFETPTLVSYAGNKEQEEKLEDHGRGVTGSISSSSNSGTLPAIRH